MPYDAPFAQVYDIIVHQEPEAFASDAELRFVDWALRRAGAHRANILDAGCGRGRYLVPLARAGHRLTGVDSSADMLAGCRGRLLSRSLPARLIRADVERLPLDRTHDAILCMDSVVGYVLQTARILSLLSTFRDLLRPGGVLVLDFWNIFAQWTLFGQTTRHRFADGRVEVEWEERYTFEDFPAVLRTQFAGRVVADGVTRGFDHEEVLRASTAEEMKTYLRVTGFEQVEAYADHDFSARAPLTAEAIVLVAFRP